MTFEVSPYLSQGHWLITHTAYFGYAHMSYEEYKKIVAALEETEYRLTIESKKHDLPEDMIHGFVSNHEAVKNLHFKAYRESASCLLFACMTLEGFINDYGVKRLGERFYQANIERTGIVEKFAIVGACCGQWDTGSAPDFVADIREMFDRRNRMVHPKTREFSWERMRKHVYQHPSELAVGDQMQRLERCIDFICKSDESIPRDFTFNRDFR